MTTTNQCCGRAFLKTCLLTVMRSLIEANSSTLTNKLEEYVYCRLTYIHNLYSLLMTSMVIKIKET